MFSVEKGIYEHHVIWNFWNLFIVLWYVGAFLYRKRWFGKNIDNKRNWINKVTLWKWGGCSFVLIFCFIYFFSNSCDSIKKA